MKQALNFDWGFLPYFKDEFINKINVEEIERVNIPHNPVEVPYNYFSEEDYQKIFTYEKFFNVEKYDPSLVYILKFDGFMLKAKIYLNDEYLGEFVSGYIPIKIDVSKYIKKDNNRLLVILDSKEDSNYPPFGFAIDYLTFAGLYREINLLSHPKTYLDNFYIHTNTKGHIKIIYDIVGENKLDINHIIFFEGEEIASFSENEFDLNNIKLWDLNHPYLYELITEIKDGVQSETYHHRFAFKEVFFKPDGFYLNDKKIKLVGLNRHQSYPYIGYAASKALQEDDALILKETGVNVIRTSHYPQSEHFLNKCDEIGLMVIDEIPGWQHISKEEIWREACVKNTKEMVLKERNHPSIIAYGVRIDESIDDHDLYTKTNEIAHQLDPYRQTIGVRNVTNSELLEDIYGYNDFSCDSLKRGLISPNKVKHMGKPYLVTEYLGHMYPVKPTSDINMKLEIALRHAKVINDNYKYENLAGAIGWCFADYHTHTDFGSGDHICPHGVYDIFRNPKLSAYIYMSQQEDKPILKSLSNFKPGDVPEARFHKIYVATNCDYIELYNNGEFVKRFYPKNKLFPNLKHPLILIDDLVGDTFKEDKFPKKDQLKIAKNLSFAAIEGFGAMSLLSKLYIAKIMKLYKVSYSDLVFYWNKYVGTWGGKARTFVIKGFVNDKEVAQIEAGPSNHFHYDINISKRILLNEDTYDTLKMNIKHLDEHNSLATYSNRVINIKVEGPLNLIGPENQSLIGGQLTVYVTSKNESGKGKIIIKADKEIKEFEVEVKNEIR